MSFVSDIFSPPSVEIPQIMKAEPAPKTTDKEALQAQQEYLAKQSLIKSKYSNIKTSGLGVPTDMLQTSRKTLLGA